MSNVEKDLPTLYYNHAHKFHGVIKVDGIGKEFANPAAREILMQAAFFKTEGGGPILSNY